MPTLTRKVNNTLHQLKLRKHLSLRGDLDLTVGSRQVVGLRLNGLHDGSSEIEGSRGNTLREQECALSAPLVLCRRGVKVGKSLQSVVSLLLDCGHHGEVNGRGSLLLWLFEKLLSRGVLILELGEEVVLILGERDDLSVLTLIVLFGHVDNLPVSLNSNSLGRKINNRRRGIGVALFRKLRLGPRSHTRHARDNGTGNVLNGAGKLLTIGATNVKNKARRNTEVRVLFHICSGIRIQFEYPSTPLPGTCSTRASVPFRIVGSLSCLP